MKNINYPNNNYYRLIHIFFYSHLVLNLLTIYLWLYHHCCFAVGSLHCNFVCCRSWFFVVHIVESYKMVMISTHSTNSSGLNSKSSAKLYGTRMDNQHNWKICVIVVVELIWNFIQLWNTLEDLIMFFIEIRCALVTNCLWIQIWFQSHMYNVHLDLNWIAVAKNTKHPMNLLNSRLYASRKNKIKFLISILVSSYVIMISWVYSITARILAFINRSTIYILHCKRILTILSR